MGAFLGMVWCFARLLLPSASGRKRHNVLGAYDPITHEAITVTNDTYINQDVFCEFLEKLPRHTLIVAAITLILDNARYQNVSRSPTRQKNWLLNCFICLPIHPTWIWSSGYGVLLKNRFCIASITIVSILSETASITVLVILAPVSKMRCKAWWPWNSSYFKKPKTWPRGVYKETRRRDWMRWLGVPNVVGYVHNQTVFDHRTIFTFD